MRKRMPGSRPAKAGPSRAPGRFCPGGGAGAPKQNHKLSSKTNPRKPRPVQVSTSQYKSVQVNTTFEIFFLASPSEQGANPVWQQKTDWPRKNAKDHKEASVLSASLCVLCVPLRQNSCQELICLWDRSNSRKSLISMIIPDNSALFLRQIGQPSQTQSNPVKPVKPVKPGRMPPKLDWIGLNWSELD
jgi:hypothetical protein